jgi:SAM-dependent methyltransferase
MALRSSCGRPQWHAARVIVPFDYDVDPERYRSGMRIAGAHAEASLYDWVARMLRDLGARNVLDVGCADGPLRAALPPRGPRLTGLDLSAALLRAHPPPVVRGDAARLPFVNSAFDGVTMLNVLYHSPDPSAALREARRVLCLNGHVLTSTISREDSPELAAYWRRPRTTFDAEDAPAILGLVFAEVTVHRWDAPLLTLPDAAAVRDYLLGRQAPRAAAEAAAAELSTPMRVTKRGAVLVGRRHTSEG